MGFLRAKPLNDGRMNVKKLLSLLILSAFLLSGCTVRELNQRMVILGMGIDFSDNNYTVTAVYINTESVDGKEKYKTKSGKGKTVTQAVNDIATENGLEVLYSHISFIVLGKSVCQHGLKETMEFFSGYYQCRPSADVLVSNTTAEAVLTAKNISPETFTRIAQSQTVTGLTRTLPFYQFYADILNPSVSACTSLITRTKDDEVKSQGTAVFDRDTFAYTLDGIQTLGLLFITETSDISAEVIPLTARNKTCTLTHRTTKVNVQYKDGILYCDVHVSGTVNLYEYALGESQLKKSAENSMETIIRNTLAKCLRQGNDIFYFTRKLRRQDKQTYYNIHDWQSVLKNTVFTVRCDISPR